MSEMLKYLQDKREEIIATLGRVVEMESPSTDKEAVDRLASYLAREFAAVGGDVEVVRQERYGDHLRISWGQGEDQILVLCHMDTVWPVGEIERRPFRIEGDKAYGPGVFDMKGGLVQTLFALKALRELGRVPKHRVVVLCNSDEEIGSPSSRPLIEAEARRSKYVLVAEPAVPPDGALKTWRKGVGFFRLEIEGKSSHAGADPEKGVSAVEELAHQVLYLHGLTDYEKGSTVNVGVVAGGTRSNVVAARAEAEIDLRVMNEAEARRLTEAILNLKPVLTGTTLRVTGGMNRPPMERAARNVALYERAAELGRELGLTLKEAGSGGGSDGNFTAALGIPTLDGVGAVGDGSHAVHEHVIVDTLVPRTALMARLMECL